MRHTNALKKKGDDRRHRAISEREAMALVAVSPPKLAVTWRMFLLAGIRAGELLNLDWRDLDLNGETRRARILKAKSQRPRAVKLYPRLAASLAAWRAERPLDPTAPVFLSAAGERWKDAQTIRRRLLTWTKRANMSPHKLTTRSLRHTYVALASHKNASIGDVESTTGHASLRMVCRYMHDDDGKAFGLTATMEEFDQLLHDLTPAQESDRVRELVAAVRAEGYAVPEARESDDMPRKGLPSAYRRLERRA